MKKLTALLLILALALSMTACIPFLTPTQSLEDCPYKLFAASSIGIKGDVTFYSTFEPENGYLWVENEDTGVFSFDGKEYMVTWDDKCVYIGDGAIPYLYKTYYDSELGREDALLTLYFTEAQTSLALRPIIDEALE